MLCKQHGDAINMYVQLLKTLGSKEGSFSATHHAAVGFSLPESIPFGCSHVCIVVCAVCLPLLQFTLCYSPHVVVLLYYFCIV